MNNALTCLSFIILALITCCLNVSSEVSSTQKGCLVFPFPIFSAKPVASSGKLQGKNPVTLQQNLQETSGKA